MTKQEALFQYTLRLGDSALILGHRLTEWCSNGPILEEDLAISNLALDLLGQASSFLKYAGQAEEKGRTEDDLAYKRDERHFYNHLISELPNGDFAFTITRQFLYSQYAVLLFTDLSGSKDETIAAIAAKSLKEMKYHYRHSADWMLRFGDGTDESHERVQKALNEIWTYTGELFEMDEADKILLKENISVDLKKIHEEWKNNIRSVIDAATLECPEDSYMQTGGKKGLHTESLGFILAEMQYLPRAYPDAKW